jgi:hypothetical protein
MAAAESTTRVTSPVTTRPREVRTITILHIISARPSKQPLMVRTPSSRYIWSSAPILLLEDQIKDIIIFAASSCSLWRWATSGGFNDRVPQPQMFRQHSRLVNSAAVILRAASRQMVPPPWLRRWRLWGRQFVQ